MMTQRRALINEIHFTYEKLVKLLRAMAPRERHGVIGGVVQDHLAHDIRTQHRVVELGLDLGMPPGPCVCADAETVLEIVHHADRLDRSSSRRDRSILEALKGVRAFLIRCWAVLLNGIDECEGRGPLHERILAFQGDEAELHRALVREINGLGDDAKAHRRSA
jgi:hypothetical protein